MHRLRKGLTDHICTRIGGLALMSFVSIVLSTALPSMSLGQPTPDERPVWREYLEWLAAQPPNSDPRQLVGAYRTQLVRNGASEAEADRRMAVVSKLAFREPEGVKLLWNKVYAGDKPIFTEEPNALLVQTVQSRPPGRALDVGMGQGRNSVFLALNKWDVTGFDPSDEGVRASRANAQKLGIELTAVISTDNDFNFGQERWDLILVTYVRNLTRADADRYWRALRPGGVVVYENGAAEGNEVLLAFSRFRIVRWEDVLDFPDWNRDRQIRIQKLVAEKARQ
jgi:predicted O-methyltransferase YrrM